jgi:hypothetical protein
MENTYITLEKAQLTPDELAYREYLMFLINDKKYDMSTLFRLLDLKSEADKSMQ